MNTILQSTISRIRPLHLGFWGRNFTGEKRNIQRKKEGEQTVV